MKKNKIFQNKIKKKIDNNQKSFNIIEDIKDNNDIIKDNNLNIDNISVEEKINMLLNRNGYIFNVDVEIVTESKTYKTRIAGKVNGNLITLDNDIIPIRNIKDIIIND